MRADIPRLYASIFPAFNACRALVKCTLYFFMSFPFVGLVNSKFSFNVYVLLMSYLHIGLYRKD